MNILKRFAPELLTMSIIRKPLGDKDGAQNVHLFYIWTISHNFPEFIAKTGHGNWLFKEIKQIFIRTI